MPESPESSRLPSLESIPRNVIVINVDIPFWQMVRLCVKWIVAAAVATLVISAVLAIPSFIVAFIVGMALR